MAAAPWTVRALERAVEAERCSVHASGLISTAVPVLASPMHVADAPGARDRVERVVSALSVAGGGLTSAAATAAAAELLALRGGAADPTAPLPSVDVIPDAHPGERSALGMLRVREARVHAETAYNNVGWCCERLLTAYNLLEHPGLPGVGGLVDAERAAAHGYLVAADTHARVSTMKAQAARLFLSS